MKTPHGDQQLARGRHGRRRVTTNWRPRRSQQSVRAQSERECDCVPTSAAIATRACPLRSASARDAPAPRPRDRTRTRAALRCAQRGASGASPRPRAQAGSADGQPADSPVAGSARPAADHLNPGRGHLTTGASLAPRPPYDRNSSSRRPAHDSSLAISSPLALACSLALSRRPALALVAPAPAVPSSRAARCALVAAGGVEFFFGAMDRNSAPPKTKPPSPKESDSEEESETSDEETEDEEQAEGSDFESESDKSTADTTKKKLTTILPTKQQSATKASVPATPAPAPGSPAKRTREVNGKKDKEDEPPSKKKKPEVATPATKSAAPKPSAPQADKKKESASKAKPATAAKDKPSKDSTAEKDTKRTVKKKPQSPAAKSKSITAEGETPQKSAKPSRPWSQDEELLLSREIQKDRVYDVYGANLPAARADPYWEKLICRLPFMVAYEKDIQAERLCEKVRRMRLRYDALQLRLKAGETSVWKNDHEGKLWRIWHTIWGPNKATPEMLKSIADADGDGEEEEEEDESEEEDDDDDEESDEEEEIEPTQAKGRQPSATNASTQKKPLSRKKAQSSSDDDESNKEETPVKATPPAVLAAPAVAAAVAGKQPPASKSVPTKAPAHTAMEVDVNTIGKNTSQRVAAHNGAQGAPVSKVVLSDELRAENLAFLRDMRGTCVKMVEEAKTQSLLISERMLEETRAKTTQIVEEAREKSSQIMEELRMVVERLGAIAGQNGRANGSGVNYSENPFQGGSLLGNGLLGDQSQLEGRWREQSEAEQGLLLQRLQLVQEQARVQQEGIKLTLQLKKQQQAKPQEKA